MSKPDESVVEEATESQEEEPSLRGPKPDPEIQEESNFRKDLQCLINRHNRESDSDTPDFILADYLLDCLEAFDKATRHRTELNSISVVKE